MFNPPCAKETFSRRSRGLSGRPHLPLGGPEAAEIRGGAGGTGGPSASASRDPRAGSPTATQPRAGRAGPSRGGESGGAALPPQGGPAPAHGCPRGAAVLAAKPPGRQQSGRFPPFPSPASSRPPAKTNRIAPARAPPPPRPLAPARAAGNGPRAAPPPPPGRPRAAPRSRYRPERGGGGEMGA